MTHQISSCICRTISIAPSKSVLLPAHYRHAAVPFLPGVKLGCGSAVAEFEQPSRSKPAQQALLNEHRGGLMEDSIGSGDQRRPPATRVWLSWGWRYPGAGWTPSSTSHRSSLPMRTPAWSLRLRGTTKPTRRLKLRTVACSHSSREAGRKAISSYSTVIANTRSVSAITTGRKAKD